MGNVREISCAWPHPRRDFQSLLHAEMRRMRFIAQGVDDQDFYAGDKIDNRPWHRAAVAQVRHQFLARAREEVAVHDGIAMGHRQRCNPRLA